MDTEPRPLALSALVAGLDGARIVGGRDPLVRGLAIHSRKVREGDLFVCVPGNRDDGHRHARDAMARGAVALVVAHIQEEFGEVPQVRVGETRPAMSALAARFYGYSSSRLRVVGITGTEGKTTTAFLLDSILRAAGRTTGCSGRS